MNKHLAAPITTVFALGGAHAADLQPPAAAAAARPTEAAAATGAEKARAMVQKKAEAKKEDAKP